MRQHRFSRWLLADSRWSRSPFYPVVLRREDALPGMCACASRTLSHLGAPPLLYLVFVLTVIGTVVAATLSFRHFESIFLRKKSEFSVRT